MVLLFFTTFCDWLKKTRAFSPTNQMQGKNLSQPGRTRFPALFAGNVYFTRVLIGLLCALYLSLLTIETGYREAR